MGPPTTLILPGLGNSGPEHWQSRWERDEPGARRVVQAEWDAPRCQDWVDTLSAAVGAEPGTVVLVAHSSSCGLVAHWARQAPGAQLSRVRGALLVAPSDPDGGAFPAGPTGFSPIPLDRLPFPSIVASANDPYVSRERARQYAEAWGSAFVDVGAAGHINAESGLGDWPVGRALLDGLRGGRGGRA